MRTFYALLALLSLVTQTTFASGIFFGGGVTSITGDCTATVTLGAATLTCTQAGGGTGTFTLGQATFGTAGTIKDNGGSVMRFADGGDSEMFAFRSNGVQFGAGADLWWSNPTAYIGYSSGNGQVLPAKGIFSNGFVSGFARGASLFVPPVGTYAGVEISTPATPPSGTNELYWKSDHLLYQKTSAGVESAIGGGSTGNFTFSGDTLADANSATLSVTGVGNSWTIKTANNPGALFTDKAGNIDLAPGTSAYAGAGSANGQVLLPQSKDGYPSAALKGMHNTGMGGNYDGVADTLEFDVDGVMVLAFGSTQGSWDFLYGLHPDSSSGGTLHNGENASPWGDSFFKNIQFGLGTLSGEHDFITDYNGSFAMGWDTTTNNKFYLQLKNNTTGSTYNKFYVEGVGGTEYDFYLSGINSGSDALPWVIHGQNNAGAGAGGDLKLRGGTSGSGTAGTVDVTSLKEGKCHLDPIPKAVSCSGSTNLDLSLASNFLVTATANCTLTQSNPQDGCAYFAKLLEDGTGAWTWTLPATWHFPSNTTPTWDTVAAHWNTVACVWDGTNSVQACSGLVGFQ